MAFHTINGRSVAYRLLDSDPKRKWAGAHLVGPWQR